MASKVLLGEDLMFPSEYLAAENLLPHPKTGTTDYTLTITGVALEPLFIKKKNATEPKPVLHFAETKKKLVCNKTNAGTIAALYGNQAKEWVGKRITVYPTTCKVGKSTETCIRIREKVPPARGQKAEPDPAALGAPEPRECTPGENGCDETYRTIEGRKVCALHQPAT